MLLKRILASVLDHVLMMLLMAVVAFLFGTKMIDKIDHSTFYRLGHYGKLFVLVFYFFYYPAMQVAFGASIGQHICKLQVVPRTKHNLLVIFLLLCFRNFVSIIESMATFCILPIILIAIKGRRLSDYATNTMVFPTTPPLHS